MLITGAGGSIGSALARRLHRSGLAKLMLLDRDDSALHAVQLSQRGRALLDTDEVILADVCDAATLRRVFHQHRPDVVFHAAALKHLSLLERYPDEALRVNVQGTANVLEAAARVGVAHFVNISTDKAADPTSALGLSKRVGERLTAASAQRAEGEGYCSVRFGNVRGSRGSVVPTFAAQIAADGPVTVTHPDVTRFFMSDNEAVDLVLAAAGVGGRGGVLVADLGVPVRILDVAEQLIAASGRDVEVVFTGLRDGEKVREVLVGQNERAEPTAHPSLSRIAVEPLDPDVVRRAGGVEPEVARKLLEEWGGV